MPEFRVGVVCEGATDFIAIKTYMQNCLANSGLATKFISLQPDMDATRQDGGWTKIATWLSQDTIEQRKIRYLSKGLFANQMDPKACDAILLQIDADVYSEQDFVNFNLKYFEHVVPTTNSIVDRRKNLISVLFNWSGVTNQVSDQYIPCIAIQATENWCIAAHKSYIGDLEELSGQDLTDQFLDCMKAVLDFPIRPSEEKMKDQGRRERYCAATVNGSGGAYIQCSGYRAAIEDLKTAHAHYSA